MDAAVKREFNFTREDFEYLREVANRRTGIVVTDDKFDMFYSRLSRRVRALGLRDFKSYCKYLDGPDGSTEALELVNAITTNLTSFFREQHHFTYLKDIALPELFESRRAQREIRIWSAGCSSGEEPYSIAATCYDALPIGSDWRVSILATDIDSEMLDIARRAVYPEERVASLGQDRLRRWFVRGRGNQAGMVKVRDELTGMVRFANLNLMNEWSLPPMDLIFCRNVIIYFNQSTKQRLADTFARQLSPLGLLFVGHSETLQNICDRFELLGKTVYRKLR